MMLYHITDHEDAIQFHDVDVGDGMKPKRVVERSSHDGVEYIALHIPGHKRWGGNFQPQVYEPAKFMVIYKTSNEAAKPVISFPIRTPSRYPA